ncbi:DUF1275 domain-containing protein [Acinetobacter qingfengensis]|uniref:Uncharacterized protein n=1 Tax=Acinetobacter qingfengensis TaxID=1262585 RepID=A0A1E7RCW8_9GAMM|nr:YoaK family protein [Acinetobacter qingfengensis]KAA8734980.1 DUF1275 domain-containing protein [Acinetobacter qingfengensis]OEY97067.1 hypothetical protein BJI46_11080 [Acinetobacter qingfengensis]
MPLQQLPNWIQFGAFLLALNAGMINVLSLITVLHQSISHMTGNVSVFAIAWSHQDYRMMIYVLLVVIFFVLGSFYSGYILGDGNVQLGRRYGIPLTLVSLFILLCWCFIPYFPRYALLWAAAAMGMQNAMVSHYRGTIIRTTHLSGVLTDIGLAFGYLVRGLKVDPRRLLLHFLILSGFFVGGVIATIIYKFWGTHAFLIPAILTASLSLTYWALYLRQHPYH